eukprot:3751119-Amphidinium_carterae.1
MASASEGNAESCASKEVQATAMESKSRKTSPCPMPTTPVPFAFAVASCSRFASAVGCWLLKELTLSNKTGASASLSMEYDPNISLINDS